MRFFSALAFLIFVSLGSSCRSNEPKPTDGLKWYETEAPKPETTPDASSDPSPDDSQPATAESVDAQSAANAPSNKSIGAIPAEGNSPQLSGDHRFNFTFTEAALIQLEIDGLDFTGFGLNVSSEYKNNLYAGASFFGAVDDDLDGLLAINSFALFCGLHRPINDQIEAYGSLGFVHTESEAFGTTVVTDDEFFLEGGALYSPTDKLQFSASVAHLASDSSLSLGARWFASDQRSFAVSLIEDGALFGLRLSY